MLSQTATYACRICHRSFVFSSLLVIAFGLAGCMTPSERGDIMIANQKPPSVELKRSVAAKLLSRQPTLSGRGAQVSDVLPIGPNFALVCIKSPKAPDELPIVYINDRGASAVGKRGPACATNRIRWNPFPELAEQLKAE